MRHNTTEQPLGAPLPPKSLTFVQHNLVVPEWQSLVHTLNDMIYRIEHLEATVKILEDERRSRLQYGG